jgi:hypothetical protein
MSSSDTNKQPERLPKATVAAAFLLGIGLSILVAHLFGLLNSGLDWVICLAVGSFISAMAFDVLVILVVLLMIPVAAVLSIGRAIFGSRS